MSSIRRPLDLRHRVLIAAFIAAVLVTAVFGVRAIVSAVYWSQHRDMPIEPWMTIGMVARSYEVPPEDLAAALGYGPGRSPRRPIGDLATEAGLDPDAAVARLEAFIAAHRADRAGISAEDDPGGSGKVPSGPSGDPP